MVLHQQGGGADWKFYWRSRLQEEARRGGGFSPCMCLCTVYGSHRVHLFKNQKHLFLYHQGFCLVFFFAKTRNEKKKSVSAVHSKAKMPVFCFSASCRLLTPIWAPSAGHMWGKLYPGGSLCGPPPRRSRQPIYNRSFLHIWLWGPGPSKGPSVSAEIGTTPQSLVPSLKTFLLGFAPLPESL